MALNLLGNTGTGGLLGNLGTTISGLVDPILPGGQTGTGAVDTVEEDEEKEYRASRAEPKAEDVFGKSTYVADDEDDED